MPIYESDNPQTNLPHINFHQRLGYKHRQWLSNFNKYETIIPTIIDAEGEEVPSYLIAGRDIGFNITQDPDSQMGHALPIYHAEGLLMREILEHLTYTLEEDSWYNYTAYSPPLGYSYVIDPPEMGYVDEYGVAWVKNSKTIINYVRWDKSLFDDFQDVLGYPYEGYYTPAQEQTIKDSLYVDAVSVPGDIISYDENQRFGSYLTGIGKDFLRVKMNLGDFVVFNLIVHNDFNFKDQDLKARPKQFSMINMTFASRYVDSFFPYQKTTYTYDIITNGSIKTITLIDTSITMRPAYIWFTASGNLSPYGQQDASMRYGVESYSYIGGKETEASLENRSYRPIHDNRINMLMDLDAIIPSE